MFTRFNAILGVLFVIILVVGPIQDALFGFVIIANTLIGIVQELRAKRTLDRLAVISEARPRVRRDGTSVELATAASVVLDDLVELGPGDQVVVDGVVLEADGLEVDESLLTGEADPVDKQAGRRGAVRAASWSPAAGAIRPPRWAARPTRRKLAEEARRFTLVDSELRVGINQILRYVTWVMVPTAVGADHLEPAASPRATDVDDALRADGRRLVPMVPEGLVLLTSIAFAVGVIRSAGASASCRSCPRSRASPASTSCASTRPARSPRTAWTGRGASRSASADEATAERVARRARPPPTPGQREPAGDRRGVPGRRAGRRPATAPVLVGPQVERRELRRRHGTWVLGAPDMLLPDGSTRALAEAERLGATGPAGAAARPRADGAVDAATAPGTVEPVALVVLEQQVRPDAADTLALLRRAGRRRSRSSPATTRCRSARSPASLRPAAAPRTPSTPASCPDDRGRAGRRARGRHRCSAGSRPQQKRAMVGALQSRGHTVAMTGDGVNDVLALKDADIGVAMGSGSPATRAVAQIVLLDNSFATLPAVVAEGRRVIGNIERVANLFLDQDRLLGAARDPHRWSAGGAVPVPAAPPDADRVR